MADTKTPQPDYDAIAHQAYEWLKKRRTKGEISTFEVLMKINGYKWGSKELEQLEELDLFEVHGRLPAWQADGAKFRRQYQCQGR